MMYRILNYYSVYLPIHVTLPSPGSHEPGLQMHY
ncbi:unnamed protein product [Paramecium octaurelia]|uniref:Uncharacterized protein n=1 Tax=Paramecium octaurelia TaxID=43137 RepID=A0A8S1TMF2_PAROT|nr:unnamed protein product [Paramecium octaurelia]